MAAVAESVLLDSMYYPDYSYLVLGDFNVGHSDSKKNGTKLNKDCYSNCGSKDLYDETHAILIEGIIGNLRMKNLTMAIPDSTYPTYAGSPIDNIYVSGAFVNRFSDAMKGSNTFGSDHLPVWVVLE